MSANVEFLKIEIGKEIVNKIPSFNHLITVKVPESADKSMFLIHQLVFPSKFTFPNTLKRARSGGHSNLKIQDTHFTTKPKNRLDVIEVSLENKFHFLQT